MPIRSSFWRYTAFQIPSWLIAGGAGWMLCSWLGQPRWVALLILGVWVIKDYALYPWLRSVYAVDPRRPIEQLIGLRGHPVEPLLPTGYVRVRGELWLARAAEEIHAAGADSVVEVVGVDGASLVVRPIRPAPATRTRNSG